MPQFFPAKSPAAPNREMPTIAMAGAIVSGVMKRRINPTTPQQLTVIEFFDLKTNSVNIRLKFYIKK